MARRPRTLLAVLLAVAAVAVVWKVAVRHDPPRGPNASPNATADDAMAAVGGRNWVRGLPVAMTDARPDELSLSAAEVAPARFAHQLVLARRALSPQEQIGVVKVQTDGTLVVLAITKVTRRWVATKQDLDPTPLPRVDELAMMKPLTAADIDTRAPAKLRRVILRAGGVAPGRLMLWHTARRTDSIQSLYLPNLDYVFGDTPVWQVKWPKLVGGLYASADAHTVRDLG